MAVPSQKVQHVVKKSDACLSSPGALAVEPEAHLDLRFGCLPPYLAAATHRG
jgi:hypothetical protein